jgi:hypothetical protein
MQGVAIQSVRGDYPTALGIERLEKFVLQPAAALHLPVISAQVFQKPLHQG